MASSNLEALNELIQKIKAGEGTAESNLEALNMLSIIAGGTGTAKSNLEALNELLTVFTPGGETQEKSVTITKNGTTEITPDAGYTLSKAVVVTDVPTKPEQTKSVTITENGTTQITPDEGFTLSGASVSVSVSGESGYNVKLPIIATQPSMLTNCLASVTEIDFTNIQWGSQRTVLDYFFYQIAKLKKIIWGTLPAALGDGGISIGSMLAGCQELEGVDFTAWGSHVIKKVASIFSGCYALKTVNWGGLKVNAPDLSNLFYYCRELQTVDTSFLDENYTGVTNISGCFRNCEKLTEVNLAALRTESIANTSNAFENCNALTNIIFEDNCFSNAKLTQLNFTGAPLSHDCAVDIFNKLATRTNSPTLTLSATTKGYLTDDEIAIATNKGWVVS